MKIDSSTMNVNSYNVQGSKPIESSSQISKAATMSSGKAQSGLPKGGAGSVDSYVEFSNKPEYDLTMDEKAWISVIEKANKALTGSVCNFEFSIHEVTKSIMVKIIDKETKEIIREIPPEKILDMIAKMWELAGIVVDERR